MNLGGAACVVTGATQGIGRAIATALGKRGATVAVCARNERDVALLTGELRSMGARAVGAPCDVADEASVAAFHSLVDREIGPADVVVNNAGVGFFAPLDELTVTQFDQTLGVNVRGTFLVTRAFVPAMKSRGTGHIVNIASLAARSGFEGGTAYAASKHAVLGFSRSLMLELRQYGIRVMTICPGSVVTRFFRKAGAEIERPDRKLQPEDVADAVIAALTQPDRALVSELDLRPTTP